MCTRISDTFRERLLLKKKDAIIKINLLKGKYGKKYFNFENLNDQKESIHCERMVASSYIQNQRKLLLHEALAECSTPEFLKKFSYTLFPITKLKFTTETDLSSEENVPSSIKDLNEINQKNIGKEEDDKYNHLNKSLSTTCNNIILMKNDENDFNTDNSREGFYRLPAKIHNHPRPRRTVRLKELVSFQIQN